MSLSARGQTRQVDKKGQVKSFVGSFRSTYSYEARLSLESSTVEAMELLDIYLLSLLMDKQGSPLLVIMSDF